MAVSVANTNPIVTMQPGDNLFRIAAVYLGSADQWNRIMQIPSNLAQFGGVCDPFAPAGAPLQIRIPSVRLKGGNGGIFGV